MAVTRGIARALARITSAFRTSALKEARAYWRSSAGEGTVAEYKAKAARDLSPALFDLVVKARADAVAAANEFLVSEARAHGIKGPVAEIPNPGYAPAAVETAIRERLNHTAGSVDDLVTGLESHVRNAARQVVVDAAEAEPEADPDFDEANTARKAEQRQARKQSDRNSARPRAWARRLTGNDNCGFCVMLASRGAVYGSAAAAGGTPPRGFTHDIDALLTKYHDHCDCEVVPVWTSKDWPGKQQAEALYEEWLRVTSGTTARGTTYATNKSIKAFDRWVQQRLRDGKPLPGA